MVSLMVFVVFSNAPPMGLDAFEGDDEEEVDPPPPAVPLGALPDVDVFDDEEEVEPPPPAAPLDGCAGPIKALSEE